MLFKFCILSNVERSCKCVANKNLIFDLENFIIDAATMAFPDKYSVPLHTSSPITSECSSASFNIHFNSFISTINVDSPLNKLSFPVILVNNVLNTP